MQQPENHSPEEIEKLRHFAYRAFSPDSEPPPRGDEHPKKSDSVKKDTVADSKKEERQNN